MATPPTPDGPPKKSPWTPRRIILGVIVLYVLIVVLANRNQVAVNFVFFKTEASLFVVLLPMTVASILGSYLFFAQHSFKGMQIMSNETWTFYRAALQSSSAALSSPTMARVAQRWFSASALAGCSLIAWL